MIIECFTGGPFFTNCYLVADEDQKVCCLFDAAHGTTEQIVRLVEEKGWTLESIYLTHSHFDHLGDVAELKRKLNPQIFVHPSDKPNVINPGADRVPLMIPTEGIEPDKELKEGDILHIGSIEIRVIETPGHSPGSVSFYFPKEKFVINGDLIFQGGRGRTDLPGCDEEVLYKSMKKLLDLEEDVIIYSGHGNPTTVKAERNQI